MCSERRGHCSVQGRKSADPRSGDERPEYSRCLECFGRLWGPETSTEKDGQAVMRARCSTSVVCIQCFLTRLSSHSMCEHRGLVPAFTATLDDRIGPTKRCSSKLASIAAALHERLPIAHIDRFLFNRPTTASILVQYRTEVVLLHRYIALPCHHP